MFKILFFSIWFLFHPVHVTFTSIDYVPDMNSFKVFIRMYFDDFQRDCKLNGVEIQDTGFSADNASSKTVIERYLNEVMMISANTKQLSGKLLDMNLADNEISMNMEYSAGKKLKVLTVKNLILTGLYSDQSNMIIVKINDFEEGFKLTSDKMEQTFNLK
ncbi:MAG TPA: DUF6702 family protein [Bacteroidales bacterium]